MPSRHYFTPSELETLADGLLAEIPIPGVEGCGFDSEIIRQTRLQAAVDQKFIKPATDSTRGTYSDDYTLAQRHTVPPDEPEATVNDLFVQQAAMTLGPGLRIASNSSISTTTVFHTLTQANSVTRNPAMAPHSAIAISLDPSAVKPDHSFFQSDPSVVMNRKATRSSGSSTSSQPSHLRSVDSSLTVYDGILIEQLDAAVPVALSIVRGGEQMAEKIDTAVSYWTEYVIYEGSERELCFALAVCVSYQQDNRSKESTACSFVHAWRAIWLIARREKLKPSTRNARPLRQLSGRCAKRLHERVTTDPAMRLVFILVSF